MRRLDPGALAAISLLLVACAGTAGSEPTPVPAPGFSAARILVEGDGRSLPVQVEVAADQASRQQGLMFRDELPDGRGMLFIYPQDSTGGHWMKDTYIPLDIAYIDSSGRVVALVEGRPLDLTVLSPGLPFRYVLEVPRGWFERNGLGVGATIVLPADLPPGR